MWPKWIYPAKCHQYRLLWCVLMIQIKSILDTPTQWWCGRRRQRRFACLLPWNLVVRIPRCQAVVRRISTCTRHTTQQVVHYGQRSEWWCTSVADGSFPLAAHNRECKRRDTDNDDDADVEPTSGKALCVHDTVIADAWRRLTVLWLFISIVLYISVYYRIARSDDMKADCRNRIRHSARVQIK